MHIIWKSGLIPFRLYQRKHLLSAPSPLHMISIDTKDIPSLPQPVKSIKRLLQRRQLKQFFLTLHFLQQLFLTFICLFHFLLFLFLVQVRFLCSQ